jgi:hypothetical protein
VWGRGRRGELIDRVLKGMEDMKSVVYGKHHTEAEKEEEGDRNFMLARGGWEGMVPGQSKKWVPRN